MRNIKQQLSSERGVDTVGQLHEFSLLLTQFIPRDYPGTQGAKESGGFLWNHMGTLMGGATALQF